MWRKYDSGPGAHIVFEKNDGFGSLPSAENKHYWLGGELLHLATELFVDRSELRVRGFELRDVRPVEGGRQRDDQLATCRALCPRGQHLELMLLLLAGDEVAGREHCHSLRRVRALREKAQGGGDVD